VFNFPPDRKRRAAFPSSNALRPRQAEFNRLCVNLVRFDSLTNIKCVFSGGVVYHFLLCRRAAAPPTDCETAWRRSEKSAFISFLDRIEMNAACAERLCMCIWLLIYDICMCMWPQQLHGCKHIASYISIWLKKLATL